MTSQLLEQRSGHADVCAVFITHHPDGGFPARLSRILGQVGATVIVDNGSNADSLAMLRELAANPAITVVYNAGNLGVAHALNHGVQLAAARGFAWALLFDQDTEADADLVDTLLATSASHPAALRVAVVGSRFRDTSGYRTERCLLEAHGEHWQEVEFVITSGSLLSLAAYAVVGPFRNEFFIDLVDVEYCFRARAAGYRVIETRRPLMSHTVGAPTWHRLFWSTQWTTNHSAERRYYIARNNTVLLREYRTADGHSWQRKSLVRCFRLCKRIAFYEHDKLRKIRAVGQGWWDAVRGNMGPRP